MKPTGPGWKREEEIEEDMSIDDGPWESKGATFSSDGLFRYRLWRAWDETLDRAVFVMLNPSTADAEKLDNTVRRCVTFAREWGYGSLDVVNLFAYRATDPHSMKTWRDDGFDIIGPDNDAAIVQAVRGAGIVVCAWGGHGQMAGKLMGQPRSWYVEALIGTWAPERSFILASLGDGQPRHPLYIKRDQKPIKWPCPTHPTQCRVSTCLAQARRHTTTKTGTLWYRLEDGRIACDAHGKLPEPMPRKKRK